MQISDVTGLKKSSSGRSIQSIQSQPTEYIVTTPDVHSQQPGKVRYIFGGTQISEVDSVMHKDGHKRDTQSFIDQERSSSAISVDPNLIYTTEVVSTAPETVILSETSSSHHASSSSMQKGSSSSYTYEIVDGKERLVDSSNREWGSSQNQQSDQSFSAKFGTGVTPEVKYSENISDKAVAFDSGKPGESPMYEKKALASSRKLEQIGDSKPIEHSKDEFEHSKYDKTKKKILTDTAVFEDKRMLDTDSILESVPAGITREGLAIDSGLPRQIDRTTISRTDSGISDKNLKHHRNGDITTTTQIINDDRLDSLNSIANTSSRHETIQSSSSKKISENTSKSMASATTTTYTSKVWDDKTNTWKVVDETTVNEKDGRFKGPGKFDSPERLTSSTTTTEYITTMPGGGPGPRGSPMSTTTEYITSTPVGGPGPRGSPMSTTTEYITTIPGGGPGPRDSPMTTTTEYITTIPGKGPGPRGSPTDNLTTTIQRDITDISNIDQSTISLKNITDSTKFDETITKKTTKTGVVSSIDDTQKTTRRSSTTSTISNVDDTKDTVTRKSTKTLENISSDTTNVSKQMYDAKTKTWKEVDEKTIKSIRPSLVRYVSQESDGTFTTIYKRKVFDQKTGRWKVVDEKIIKNKNTPETIPEIIDDVTNITTTTYTTKIYDTKTGTWKIVDEKSFVDKETYVPTDIVHEIEKDHADVANITTTTEITKVNICSFSI